MDPKATKKCANVLSVLVMLELLFAASPASALTVSTVSGDSNIAVAILAVCCFVLLTAVLWLVLNNREQMGSDKGTDHLALLWRHVPDIITEIDDLGFIRKVNKAAPGYGVNELIGRDGREFLSDDGKRAFENALSAARATHKPQRYELEIGNPDGSSSWVANQIVPVLEGERQGSYLVISTDITEQKQAQEILISERVSAEEANRAKSSFLASMSHEIRTPMTGMLGMASILEQTELTAEQQECVCTIQSSAEHLLSIVNDVLDISKIEANKLEIENENFNLNEMISSLLDMMSSKAREKGLTMQSFIHDDVPTFIIADSVRLRQVLMNYLTNAIKFTMKGHILLRVIVTQFQDSTVKLRFSVEDTGIGMEQEKAAQVFEEFTDAHGKVSAMAGGTGLGLSICRRLAVLMNGSVGVVSSPDLGSNFWLDLEVALASCETESELSPEPNKPFENVTAWVLDEVKVNRLLLKEVAKRLGFSVREFNHLSDVLAVIEDEPSPDLMVFSKDQGKQKVNQLIRAVKQHGDQVFLAMTTVDAINLDYDALAEQGVHAYWEWPIGQDDLRSLLERMIAQQWSETPESVVTRFKRARLTSNDATNYRGKILLAEDNLVNQKVASQMLKKMGCEVEIAEDGQQALSAWKRNHYDLILMDCHMPVMDGLQATRMIRSQEDGRHTPILALTADVISDRKEACMQAGMDGFMSKPIRMEELRSVLAGYLQH